MRALEAVFKVLLGLTLGLVLAEGAFHLRDDGAFPHLNLYRLDEKLGVRLQPESSMRLRVANNPVTTVAINSYGYRAPEWPVPADGEVLVVGDSQVFGLGVEANETFSAKLSELLKVPVLNGGVPTYGPREYTQVVKEQLGARGKIATVVYVLNLSTDLFEVERTNVQRHTVWDGWAVRAETAPASVTWFPFRQTLMSRSHLVFAARKWLNAGGQPGQEGFSTEGSWKDVVQASAGVQPVVPEDAAARKLLEERSRLARQLEDVASRLEDHFSEKVNEDGAFAEAVKPLTPKGGDPRDIVEVRYAEGARRVEITAYQLFMASLGEGKNEAFLEKLAKSRNDPELLALIEERRAMRAQLDALKPEGEPAHVAPIERVLQETQALCQQAGARLLVVALPLDVMVSSEEWKKYGVTPIDMSPTSVLATDVVSRAERVGASGLDPTAALAAAEPGAFLDGDLHLTPRGHAALAQAIVDALNAPAKPKGTLTLPEGRSWLPTADEWRREKENTVKGSTAAGCETKKVREWLRLRCSPKEDGDGVRNIELLEGGHGDASAYQNDGAVMIIPLLPGDTARAMFSWKASQRELVMSISKTGVESFAFSEEKAHAAGRNPPALKYVQKPDADPLRDPGCGKDLVISGALRRCATRCDAQTPCPKGHCEPWPSGDFCAVP